MTDSYYYQDNNGQIFGPLTPAGLKQLANEGVIGPATPVRKGEQGAWYQAGTIAGLVTPRPAQPGPVQPEAVSAIEPDTAERARETFRKAEEHADKVADKLWFLDLKFSHVFAPKLVGALWAIYLCISVLGFLISAFQTVVTTKLLFVPFVVLFQFLGLLFALVLGRVVLEALLVVFRMGEHMEHLRHLEHLKQLENRGK